MKKRKNNKLSSEAQIRAAAIRYQQMALQSRPKLGQVQVPMSDGPRFNTINNGLSPMERAKLMNPISMAQMQAQRNDNIMNAPRFMQGELKNTGGSILTTKPGDDILHAPDVMKGQLRNLKATPTTKLGPRPQTLPQYEQYIEIDPISNRQVVKRRLSEKWATGEAL